MNDNQKRVKAVQITREVVNPLFRGDMAVIAGMPDDANFVRFYNEPRRDLLMFVFESDEFEPVTEGEVIPEMSIDTHTVDANVRRSDEW
jgi:hypothetical protein